MSLQSPQGHALACSLPAVLEPGMDLRWRSLGGGGGGCRGREVLEECSSPEHLFSDQHPLAPREPPDFPSRATRSLKREGGRLRLREGTACFQESGSDLCLNFMIFLRFHVCLRPALDQQERKGLGEAPGVSTIGTGKAPDGTVSSRGVRINFSLL